MITKLLAKQKPLFNLESVHIVLIGIWPNTFLYDKRITYEIMVYMLCLSLNQTKIISKNDE